MKDSDIFIERLYKEKYRTLYRYVHRMIPEYDLAEDIAQETFYEAYRKKEYLMKHELPMAWLFLTAKHKIMKLKTFQQKYTFLEELGEELAEPDCNYVQSELILSLNSMLTREEAKLLYEYYECGYTSKELSDKLGVTETCFRTRMFRVREKIKKIF